MLMMTRSGVILVFTFEELNFITLSTWDLIFRLKIDKVLGARYGRKYGFKISVQINSVFVL